MAKNKITDLEETAALNADFSGVDAQGTAPASNMDDLIRAFGAMVAKVDRGTDPVRDTWTFADPADLTKRVRLDAGNVTAGQTRVLAMPDANVTIPSGTLITEDSTSTLTNKTLTSPTINSPTIATPNITTSATITSTDAGAGAAPTLDLYRNSASPAASDVIGEVVFTGEDSAGNTQRYAADRAVVTDPTSASEDAKRVIRTVVAGTEADRVHVGAGAWMEGATGGDPGAGKINATEVQANGTVLGITSGTVQATTSGTSKDFTSIPSWVKRITVNFAAVSGNGASDILVQIGDSGGLETTGYISSTENAGGADSSTAGFILTSGATATQAWHGFIELTLLDAATFTWVLSGNLARSNSASVFSSGGSKSLSAALDRLRITFEDGTTAFDAGSVNILYQ